MSTFPPVPPALPPLVGCTVALFSLWIGWITVRSPTIPPLLRPIVRLNIALAEAMRGEEAARRGHAERLPADTIRAYGWAWLYAGTFGLVIAGSQLVRVIINTLG